MVGALLAHRVYCISCIKAVSSTAVSPVWVWFPLRPFAALSLCLYHNTEMLKKKKNICKPKKGLVTQNYKLLDTPNHPHSPRGANWNGKMLHNNHIADEMPTQCTDVTSSRGVFGYETSLLDRKPGLKKTMKKHKEHSHPHWTIYNKLISQKQALCCCLDMTARSASDMVI